MDDFFMQSILFDIYGNLLSEKKRMVYEYHILDDLSFAEIGEEMSLTRQACHDLFKKADLELKKYEDKLHIFQRLRDIENLSNDILSFTSDKNIKMLSSKIKRLCQYNKEEKNNGS